MLLLRHIVFGVWCLAVGVATAGWLVRTRRLSPFGAPQRLLRRLSDPFITPIERRVVRAGGSPVHAGWWMVIGTAVVGLLVIWIAQWAVSTVHEVGFALQSGPRAVLALALAGGYEVLVFALIVRVIGSWFGAFRYSPWARPAYRLTDWLVEPIRRALPEMGPFDWSPLAAWVVLWALKSFLMMFLR